MLHKRKNKRVSPYWLNLQRRSSSNAEVLRGACPWTGTPEIALKSRSIRASQWEIRALKLARQYVGTRKKNPISRTIRKDLNSLEQTDDSWKLFYSAGPYACQITTGGTIKSVRIEQPACLSKNPTYVVFLRYISSDKQVYEPEMCWQITPLPPFPHRHQKHRCCELAYPPILHRPLVLYHRHAAHTWECGYNLQDDRHSADPVQ